MFEERIKAISSSSSRARAALFVTTIIAATVFIAVWNTYFTWSRHWLDLPEEARLSNDPLRKGQRQFQDLALQQQIRLFMENKDINVGLFGIRVSSDDVPILGGLALCLVSLYAALAYRRANRDIAGLLIEAQHLGALYMREAYFGIRSELLFNAGSSNDRPIDNLEYRFHPIDPEHASVAISVRLLLYLPCIACLLATGSDLYYALLFPGEFDLNFALPVWTALPISLKVELIVLDSIGLLIGFVTWRYNRVTLGHIRGTFALMASFAGLYEKRFRCSIYDPLKDAAEAESNEVTGGQLPALDGPGIEPGVQ